MPVLKGKSPHFRLKTKDKKARDYKEDRAAIPHIHPIP